MKLHAEDLTLRLKVALTYAGATMRKELFLDRDDALLVVSLGLLTTLLGYQFGFGNQTEQLPLIYRLLDPSFLQNDFYVESASGFGPRYYYMLIVGYLASWLPVTAIILLLTVLVNISLAWISFAATRDLLNGERLACALAALLVLSVSSFPLGLVTDIRFDDFQPASLAIPACLLALWAGMRGRAILAAVLAGIACVPHPLYGAETGAIAIATAFFVGCFSDFRSASRSALIAIAILSAFVGLFWIVPQASSESTSISSDELIHILAYFRAPHHYLPSQFPPAHYLALALFLVVNGFALSRWYSANQQQDVPLAMTIPVALVLAGCFVGYLLIEVWPSRLGLVAQPFRMLYLVKWLGLLSIGWLITSWLRRPGVRSGLGWTAMLASGAAHAVAMFAISFIDDLEQRLRAHRRNLSPWLAPTLAVIATVLLVFVAGDYDENVRIAIGMSTVGILAFAPVNRQRRIAAMSVVLILVSIVFVTHSTDSSRVSFFNPIVSFDDHRGSDVEAARWARDNTPADAIFVIPPDMNAFRLIAERAVVIDFKSVPFDDIAMKEWRERLAVVYGHTALGGFAARSDLDQNYRDIDTGRLQGIARQYGASYALLYTTTETELHPLYDNRTYKVVRLEPFSHQSSSGGE